MIGIIVSEFNWEFTEKLLRSCEDKLKEFKLEYEVVKVPGAFEIPLMAQNMSLRCDVIIALGCVIKGESDHYKMVCRACTDGIMQTQLKTGIPVVFGVLMTENENHLYDRISKGYKYAEIALKILNLNKNGAQGSS